MQEGRCVVLRTSSIGITTPIAEGLQKIQENVVLFGLRNAFRPRSYVEAIRHFTEAISHDNTDHVRADVALALSNRKFAHDLRTPGL